MDVHEAASFLNVSESWIRRHVSELPVVHLGRLVRFDAVLLTRNFSGKPSSCGKSLERTVNPVTLKRYQRGTIFKQGKKKKTWYGLYRNDIMKPDGTIERSKRKVRLGTFAELPTKQAAFKELQKHMAINSKPKTTMTLSELAGRWQSAVVPTLKPSTANVYTHSLRSRVLPALGHVAIVDIGRYEVETFLAAKGKTYAKNTLRELRSSLSTVLGWAINCGWLDKNPCHGVKLPHGTGRKITRNVLTPEQVKAIASELAEPYATLIIFLAITGLRVGEAIAVKWSDFDGEVLRVQRRIYEGVADTLKTEKSKRSLPIPAALLTRLKTLDHASEWVFSSKRGSPVNPGNVLRRYVQPLARKLEIRLSGFHDLRHTLSTDLMNSGTVSAKAVSEILGHANVGITLNTYTHPALENFRAPLNQMAAKLM
jgi:integrase